MINPDLCVHFMALFHTLGSHGLYEVFIALLLPHYSSFKLPKRRRLCYYVNA